MLCNFITGISVMRLLLFIGFSLITAVAAFGQVGKVETGVASFYHDKFVGRKTANGEIFTQDKLTAAHKTLPLGTWVRVTNLSNDSVVVVRVNDRMPKSNGRSIDLTEKAAGQLNFIPKGLTKVRIEVIPPPNAPVIPKDLPETGMQTIRPETIHTNAAVAVQLAQLEYSVDWASYDARPKTKKRKLF